MAIKKNFHIWFYIIPGSILGKEQGTIQEILFILEHVHWILKPY